MRQFIFITLFFIGLNTDAQIISQFTWEMDPPTTADIGPNGTAISASAFVDVGGAGGTFGLNAGTPKADINMTIPGSPTFDVPGIDISFDYQREESQCDWWRRGNSVILDGSNQFSVTYRVDDGGGGFNTVTSGNVFNIPNDDTFRNYRFIYLNTSGQGFLMVNGVVVWTNDGPDNRDLYWTGAGDVTVGQGCDGTGNNDTFMDNLIVGSVTFSGLPVELAEYTATVTKESSVYLHWITKSEKNNDYFEVERSADGENWERISKIDGAGNSTYTNEYIYEDYNPYKGVSYYRLKQVDFDGEYEYSDIRSVAIYGSTTSPYPNPAEDHVWIDLVGVKPSNVVLTDASGRSMLVNVIEENGRTYIDVSNVPSGTYFLMILTTEKEVHTIVKH